MADTIITQQIQGPSGSIAALLGDVTGQPSANTVAKINGATAPTSPLLADVGKAMIVTAAGALGYGYPPLAGDVGGTTNASIVNSLTGTAGIVGVTSGTSLEFHGGANVLPTIGALRFPSALAGYQNTYDIMRVRTVPGQSVAGDYSVVQTMEASTNNTSLMLADPNFYYTTICGQTVSIALSQVAGSPTGAYVLVRSDGLVGLNVGRTPTYTNSTFEMSDALTADYALRFELKYDGANVLRLCSEATSFELAGAQTANATAPTMRIRTSAAKAASAAGGGELDFVLGKPDGAGTSKFSFGLETVAGGAFAELAKIDQNGGFTTGLTAGQTHAYFGIATNLAGYSGLWFGAAADAPTTANYTIRSDSATLALNSSLETTISATALHLYTSSLVFDSAQAAPVIGHNALGSGTGATMTLKAQGGGTGTGGSLVLAGGDGTTAKGDVQVQGQNLGLFGTSYGGGVGAIAVANATTAPSTNPTGGGVLYAEGGALKWRGSAGTITTMGPA